MMYFPVLGLVPGSMIYSLVNTTCIFRVTAFFEFLSGLLAFFSLKKNVMKNLPTHFPLITEMGPASTLVQK
jgi:hypothetical protein